MPGAGPQDLVTEFSAADRARLAARGIAVEEAERQLALLRRPPRPVRLDRPCTVGDGIVALSPAEQEDAVALGRAAVDAGRVTKFVPASGAATRMFQDLGQALEADSPLETEGGRRFFDHLDSFAFTPELRRLSGVAGRPRDTADARHVLRTLLDEMGYRDRPKGLVAFHHAVPPHTAFEDQLREGVAYTADRSGVSRTHLTVVPSARADFERLLASVRPRIEADCGAVLEVTFSEQHSSTDTLAVDETGGPFRTSNGELLFRPAGHGALLENLQAIDADIVVVKNIDNVLPHGATTEGARWKLILIGVLARFGALAAEWLDLGGRQDVTERDCDVLIARIADAFGRRPDRALDLAGKRAFIAAALNRPMRICGVVRNQGEPGGAPFWVRTDEGSLSVQIVESAQVDPEPGQQRVFGGATHFNPVDIVCGLRSRAGVVFDLRAFVDPDAAFLVRKFHEGRALVALERPGLWNGSMAHWNTVCVDVPGSTFAPVKTVFDLLRPQHR